MAHLQHVQHREGEGHEQGKHAGQHQPVPRQHIAEADHDLCGGKYDAAQNDGQLLAPLLGEFVHQRVHQQRPGDGDGQDQHGVRLRKTHQRGHIVHDARLKERHACALERADDQRADIAEGAAGHKEERIDGVGVHPHRPVLLPALVRAGGDQRVCHRVDDVTHRLDHADDGQHAQHQPSLRDEVGDTRCLGGLVEIDEIVIQHGRKKAHCKLRKAQPYDEGGVDFSHFSPCLLSLM